MRTSHVLITVVSLATIAGISLAFSQLVAHAGDGQQPTPTAAAPKVQRFASIIGLRPEKRDYYNKLHANPWPEVMAMLKKCNIQNYSIYEAELDGRWYLFSYFEYVGDDFKADMARMAADLKTKQWWKETDPCQVRLPGTPEGDQWKTMSRVFRLD